MRGRASQLRNPATRSGPGDGGAGAGHARHHPTHVRQFGARLSRGHVIILARRTGRYPSDTSDEQWALIEPLLPPVNTGGRSEKHPRRAVVDAILYVVRTGCSWRQLPAAAPSEA